MPTTGGGPASSGIFNPQSRATSSVNTANKIDRERSERAYRAAAVNELDLILGVHPSSTSSAPAPAADAESHATAVAAAVEAKPVFEEQENPVAENMMPSSKKLDTTDVKSENAADEILNATQDSPI